MKRLDATIHDLRKARQLGDLAHGHPGRGELAGGATGRDDLDPELGQSVRELDDPGLVRDRQHRPSDLYVLRGARRLPADGLGALLHPTRLYRSITTRRGFSGSSRTAPAAISRTASGSSSCSIGCSRALTSSGDRASGSSTARWRITRPVSTPSSTKCTVTPNSLTPYSRARS